VPEHRLLARTLRGLESIARAEVRDALPLAHTRLDHREVRFALPRLDPRLLRLRTVDDVFLVVAEWHGIPVTRAALARLRRLAGRLDLEAACRTVRALRPVAAEATFAVTASAHGRRRTSRFEVEDAVSAGIAGATGRRRTTDRDAAIALRVHLDGTAATVGVRLAARPLHRRAATPPRRGAPHPPLAAALARLAAPEPGSIVLDPTAGTGTLLAEALALEPAIRALGFDIDGEVIAHARRRLPAAALAVADAARLPLPDSSVDRVLVNPPWNRTVPARGALRTQPERLWEEIARVLVGGGRAVALLPAGMEVAGLEVVSSTWVRVAGAEARIVDAQLERARAERPSHHDVQAVPARTVKLSTWPCRLPSTPT
jgi:23S rRNA G2445 N2-methylase RlmL